MPMPIQPKPLRVLILRADESANNTLSYQIGFPKAFVCHDRFQTTVVNILSSRHANWFRLWRSIKLDRLDAIILLHSVFSNSLKLGGRLLDMVAAAPQPKVLFLGNEYKLMPEKMAFAEEINSTVLVTQFSAAEPIDLYRQRLGIPVLHIPNAAIDPETFPPGPPFADRPIDIGYRAYDAAWYLGHNERHEMAERFAEAAARRGLVADISLKREDRMESNAWAGFLRLCKAQIATEAGGDYFELNDDTRVKVNAYVKANPAAGFTDVHRRFFASYVKPVPGRIISPRNAEAAASKTVQLL
jgi:hypothetical protein